MDWFNILKVKTRSDGTVITRQKGVGKVRVGNSGGRDANRKTVRTETTPVMEYDNEETSNQNNRMQIQQRYNTESQKLQQYQQQRQAIIASGNQSKIDAMDDNSPNALNKKIMSAQKILNSLRQNLQSDLQIATQGNMSPKEEQQTVPLPRSSQSNVPLPPSSPKTNQRVRRVVKPESRNTPLPPRRRTNAQMIEAQQLRDKRRTSTDPRVRGPPRTKSPQELSQNVRDVLKPPVEDRQAQIKRRIAEERAKSEQTVRANRIKRGPRGSPQSTGGI